MESLLSCTQFYRLLRGDLNDFASGGRRAGCDAHGLGAWLCWSPRRLGLRLICTESLLVGASGYEVCLVLGF